MLILGNNKPKAIGYLKKLLEEIPEELETVQEFPLFEEIKGEREVSEIILIVLLAICLIY